MAMNEKEILALLKQEFPDARLDIKDLVGDQNHYELFISDKSLRGVSRVKQHQMIYKALGEKMGTALHALSIKVIDK